MPDFDLIVRSAEQDIAVSDGKIVSLEKNLAGSATDEIDATGLSIFPGVIDSHVHFNEPGRTDWEGWATGSRACAAGGTTTVFEMPLNAHPPTIDGAAFDEKRKAAEASSIIDFGLWGGLIPGNASQLETLRDRGVIGLKAFMCNSGIADFPHVDRATLREGMKIAAGLGLLVAVHAESEEMTAQLTAEKRLAGKTTPNDYLESRPVEAELAAIEEAIELAAETKCKLHIVHVSCGRGVVLVAKARKQGVDVTCETCPHYLFLRDDSIRTGNAAFKCAPPLRPAPHFMDLWKQLGDVSTIGSDHSPAPPEMKTAENFFDVWGGISGCQHLLTLLLNNREDWPTIPRDHVVRLTSGAVAERFGIPSKGKVAVGYDADLTLVQEGVTDTITPEGLHYRHKQSAFMNTELSSRVVRTIVRGQTVFQNGKFLRESGGQLVRLSLS